MHYYFQVKKTRTNIIKFELDKLKTTKKNFHELPKSEKQEMNEEKIRVIIMLKYNGFSFIKTPIYIPTKPKLGLYMDQHFQTQQRNHTHLIHKQKP